LHLLHCIRKQAEARWSAYNFSFYKLHFVFFVLMQLHLLHNIRRKQAVEKPEGARYIYMCVYTHVYMYTYIFIYTHTNTHAHTFMYVYIHTHIRTYAYKHTCRHIYVYTYIYTYIYLYTYIHTCIFIYIYLIQIYIYASEVVTATHNRHPLIPF
jgi:hypothetical protein